MDVVSQLASGLDLPGSVTGQKLNFSFHVPDVEAVTFEEKGSYQPVLLHLTV